MKAAGFDYARPSDVEAALQLKASMGDRATFLAGGQSLIPAFNMRLNQPGLVIDISRISALRNVQTEEGGLRVGSMVTHRELGQSDIANKFSPIFRQTSRLIAHEAIRNKGTIGGSVALADPAAEWPAVCVALDARVRLVSRHTVREVSADSFFKGTYMTDRQEDELLDSIYFPPGASRIRPLIAEFSRQHGGFATAGVVLTIDLFEGVGRSIFFAISQAPIVIESAFLSDFVTSGTGGTASLCERWIKEKLRDFELTSDLYHDREAKGHIAAVVASRALVAMRSTLNAGSIDE